MTPLSAPKRLAKLQFLPPRRRRRRLPLILGAIVIGVGLYTVAGAVIGSWLLDRWISGYAANATGRTVSRDSVGFNPFTLAGEIENLELRSMPAQTALRAGNVVADFSARSLFERRPVLSAVEIDRPTLDAPSLQGLSAIARDLRDTLLGDARIETVAVTGGAVAMGAPAARSLDIAPLSLSLGGFDGRSPDAARLNAIATSARGTVIAVEGSLATTLDRANGRVEIDGLDVGHVATLLDGAIASAAPRGRAALSAQFAAAALLDSPAVDLRDAAIEFEDLAIAPATGLGATAARATARGELRLVARDGVLAIDGRLESDDAEIAIRDSRVVPPQAFEVRDAAVVATLDGGGLLLLLGGDLADAGAATLTVSVPADDGARRVSLEADGLDVGVAAAYAPDAFRERLAAGSIDIGLDYSRRGGRAEGSLDITARDLAFAERAAAPGPPAGGTAAGGGAEPILAEGSDYAANEDTDAGTGDGDRLELAAALLEDADGAIDLELRFATSNASVREAVTDALMARLATVTETPFETLAALFDGSDAPAGAVPFLPGEAALNDRAVASVSALADALSARPRLGVRVHSGYDADADRNALARQQIELHVGLATAAPDGRARPEPVDFASPRAQDVLDEFAGERLPADVVSGLAERFRCDGPLADVCERSYYEQIFAALVENEAIGRTTLSRLGRFRGQTIVDALEARGVASERIELVAASDVTETPFGVGLPVELTPLD